MGPGHDEAVLFALMHHSYRLGEITSPSIIALEPGPMDLARGLRLLPNQVSPRLTAPELLVISTTGPLPPDDGLLALVRRCLIEGRTVWVVGTTVPEMLLQLTLEPGQSISLIPVSALEDALRDTYPMEDEPVVLPLWIFR
jgi:hypothetical protein